MLAQTGRALTLHPCGAVWTEGQRAVDLALAPLLQWRASERLLRAAAAEADAALAKPTVFMFPGPPPQVAVTSSAAVAATAATTPDQAELSGVEPAAVAFRLRSRGDGGGGGGGGSDGESDRLDPNEVDAFAQTALHVLCSGVRLEGRAWSPNSVVALAAARVLVAAGTQLRFCLPSPVALLHVWLPLAVCVAQVPT